MYAALLLAPLFPGKGSFGFYSVEWSFFFASALVMYVAFLALLRSGQMVFSTDRFYFLVLVFFVLCLASVADAPNRFKSLLFAGQYVPYFFLAYMVITFVNTREKLDSVVGMMTHLVFVLSIVAIAAGAMTQGRQAFNTFMLDTFNIHLNNIMIYAEVPFAIILYRTIEGRTTLYGVVWVLTLAAAIIMAESRGSMLVMAFIFGLVFVKTRRVGKMAAMALPLVLVAAIGFSMQKHAVERLGQFFSEDPYERTATFSRIYTGKVALELMLEHPVNGVGMGNSSRFLEDMASALDLPGEIIEYWKERQIFVTVTTPLFLGSELGLGGLIFFFLFYYYLYRRVRSAEASASGKDLSLLKGLEVAVIAGFVHNFFGLVFTQYYAWFYYGIMIAAARVAAAEAGPKPPGSPVHE
jgi:hypothetical protein